MRCRPLSPSSTSPLLDRSARRPVQAQGTPDGWWCRSRGRMTGGGRGRRTTMTGGRWTSAAGRRRKPDKDSRQPNGGSQWPGTPDPVPWWLDARCALSSGGQRQRWRRDGPQATGHRRVCAHSSSDPFLALGPHRPDSLRSVPSSVTAECLHPR